MDKVLIVEDEKELADILGAYLKMEGLVPILAYDGEEGMERFLSDNPALVLLDIMLPKLDGIEVCKRIREKSQVPIIMVSAKSQELDKVVALGVGADDYVTKPYSPLELVARVKANLRRYHSTVPKTDESIHLGRLTLNKDRNTAFIDDDELALTTKEFDTLYLMAMQPGRIFTKEEIFQQVWGYEGFSDDNSVTVYIRRIREKLKKYDVEYVHTVWGTGYKVSE